MLLYTRVFSLSLSLSSTSSARAPASSRLLVFFSERLGRLWKLSLSISQSLVARSLGFSRHRFLFDWMDRFARVRAPRVLLLLRLHRRLRRR